MARNTGAETRALLLYPNHREILEELDDADRGKLILALMDYSDSGVEPAFTGPLRMAFVILRGDVDRCNERWEAQCRRRSEAGRKGAAVRAAKKFASEVSCNSDTCEAAFRAQEAGAEPNTADPGEAVVSTVDQSEAMVSTADLRSAKEANRNSNRNQNSNNNSNPNGNSNPNQNRNERAEEPRGGSSGWGGEDGFERFWAVYPRKTGKDAARLAWAKLYSRRGGQLPPEPSVLVGAVERWRHSDQWTREGGRYIPFPANWLSQGRWEDEPPGPGYQRHDAPLSPEMQAAVDRMLAQTDFDESAEI